MDPDPGSPKTCGSGFGSGSATLVPGVTNGVVPFEHAVAGVPAVTVFPAFEGVLAVVCVPTYLL